MLEGELRRRLAAGSEANGRRWTWDSYAAALLELAGAVVEGRGR
jgi:hypothetical protein